MSKKFVNLNNLPHIVQINCLTFKYNLSVNISPEEVLNTVVQFQLKSRKSTN